MALLNEINVKGVPHPIVTDDGYYQEMTVGDAEQLVATTFTEDDTPYNFRTAGGAIDIGDRKQVKGIVGVSLPWNQYAKKLNSENWVAESGVTATFGDGIVEFASEALNNGVKNITTTGVQSVTGHKYLVMMDAKISDGTEAPAITLIGSGQAAFSCSFRLTETMSSYGKIVTANRDNSIILYVFASESRTLNKTVTIKNLAVYDLTQMFGSTIADYIYSLEQATAGAGVAWFKKLFPKPYYAYNAGQLMSVKALRHITRGFNAWDEEWEVGMINLTTGENASSSSAIRSKNYIRVVPNTAYCLTLGSGTMALAAYDADKNFVANLGGYTTGRTVTTPEDCSYIRFYVYNGYGTTYNHDICINLKWDGERDGEYEEYVEHVYELDPDLELRGVPKLTAGNDLYYDGDVYEPDGTVTRKYGIVDLGTLDWGYNSTYGYGAVSIESIKQVSVSDANKLQIVCAKYPTISARYDSSMGTTDDKTICQGIGDNRIKVKDSAYTTAPAFKTAMSGVYLVYELATPTEESADPYNGTQIVDDFGTEEFVDAGVAAGTRDVAIPVGHNSLYQPNLRAKLEMVPEAPEDEGYYVVYHHDGINEYVPLIIPQELPNLPTEDGTYTLKCTVASGSATLSFESEV